MLLTAGRRIRGPDVSAPYRVFICLLVVALACWGSYRHGRTVEAGAQALLRQSDIVTAWHAARADVSTQAKSDAVATRRADAAASRVRAVDREASRLPPRAECDWTPDELRLAAARWCARYADDDPTACQLPGGLLTTPETPEPATGVGAAD